MPDKPSPRRNSIATGTPKVHSPNCEGGGPVQNSEEWDGGSKGSKGGVTPEGKRNPNSGAKS